MSIFKALYEGSLDAGKVPGELLGRLLGGVKSDDPDLIVGPGIGRDAAAVRIGDEILVLKTDPITFASEGAAPVPCQHQRQRPRLSGRDAPLDARNSAFPGRHRPLADQANLRGAFRCDPGARNLARRWTHRGHAWN